MESMQGMGKKRSKDFVGGSELIQRDIGYYQVTLIYR